jgi:hypothetical protein
MIFCLGNHATNFAIRPFVVSTIQHNTKQLIETMVEDHQHPNLQVAK